MPPIASTSRVTLEVVDVGYPILSVAMLVATGHRVLCRAQDAVAPLTRTRGLWYLLVLINHRSEFVLVGSGAACHV